LIRDLWSDPSGAVATLYQSNLLLQLLECGRGATAAREKGISAGIVRIIRKRKIRGRRERSAEIAEHVDSVKISMRNFGINIWRNMSEKKNCRD